MGTNKGRILIIIGAAIGFILIIYGSLRLLKPAPSVAQNNAEKAKTVSVVITTKPVQRGQTLAAADLGLVSVSGNPPAGAVQSAASAIGRIAVSDIPASQLVLAPLISSDPAAAGLALTVPAGSRAISLITNDEIAIADYVRPGDHVDIQTVLHDDVIEKRNGHDASDASEARTVLHDILVLAVGSPPDPKVDPKDRNAQANPVRHQPTVTVAMTPQQVGQFTLARSLGPYFLALRNPKDNGQTAPENRARLIDIRGVGPAGGATLVHAARRVSSTATGPHPIDLVVGGHAQVIYPGAGK